MLDGKLALVVGGSSGIGAATAKLLARNGARVLITSERSEDAMQPLADEISRAGGEASTQTCDITDLGAIQALMKSVESKHGRLDVLVNCAGVFFRAPLEQMTAQQISLIFAVNVTGPINVIREALPLMKKGGGGSIVNISSGAAVLGVDGCAAYAASKAAIAHFTRTLAPELRRTGVRINAVAPGSVRTPMVGFTTDELTAEQQASMVKRSAASNSPYGNPIMEPNDIAEIVLFLASDAARSLHGSLLLADQGLSGAMRGPGD